MAIVRRGNRVEFGFAVFLAAFLGVLIGLALTYGSTSRMIPLIVAVPTFVAVSLIALSHVSGTVDALVERFNASAFTVGEDVFDEDETVYKDRPIARSVGWVLGLAAVAYLFGFVLVIPFFVYGYLRMEGGHDRRRSALIAVVTVALISGLFEVVFGTALYVGAIPELLIDLLIE
jgi:ABC-type Co2+ transport system permease subunit